MTIVVAGGTGLAGSAIVRAYTDAGHEVIPVNRTVVDLLDRDATFRFIGSVKPTLVIDAAAKVGGIGANNSYPVEFLADNVRIQSNLMEAAHAADVEKFVFLGSSCIYPRDCSQPIKEEYLLTGELEKTNEAYALAKISGLKLVQAYRKQYGHRWISAMPTNMFGPGDNFDLENSHVLPALIRKMHDAKTLGSQSVILWGTGTPKREFLHADDLGSACLFLLENYDGEVALNVGVGQDVSIAELAEIIGSIVGFEGNVAWDSSKPDGTPRKLLDVSRLTDLGWRPGINLEDGIRSTYEWYLNNRIPAKSEAKPSSGV
jgi:GDP-L-fucose synthase